MDVIDVKILEVLQENSRVSISASLAEAEVQN